MSRNHRKTFRCPLPPDRQVAKLIVGSEEIPVRLVDESRGGFSVQCDTPVPLKEGHEARLETTQGAFLVQAVHINARGQLLQPGGKKATSRIGFRRLCELDLLGAADDAVEGIGRAGRGVNHLVPSSNCIWVVAIILAVLAVGLPLLFVQSTGKDGQNRLTDGVACVVHSAVAWVAGSSKKDEGAGGSAAAGPTGAPSGSRFSAGAALSAAVGAVSSRIDLSAVRRAAEMLPAAQSLTTPAVAQYLQLEEHQLIEMRRILARAEQSLREFDLGSIGGQKELAAQNRERIMEVAHRQALRVLTPQQREQWKALWQASTAAQGVPGPSSAGQ